MIYVCHPGLKYNKKQHKIIGIKHKKLNNYLFFKDNIIIHCFHCLNYLINRSCSQYVIPVCFSNVIVENSRIDGVRFFI